MRVRFLAASIRGSTYFHIPHPLTDIVSGRYFNPLLGTLGHQADDPVNLLGRMFFIARWCSA